MSNVHRLPPMPKVKRHGVIRCEIDDAIGVRELATALAYSGLRIIHTKGGLRIEHVKRAQHGRV